MNTFPDVEPRFGVKPKITFNTLKAQFGDGYSQRGKQGINHRVEEWPLTFSLPDDECAAIAEFLDAHQGHRAFLWTPPFGIENKYICERYTGPSRIGRAHSALQCTFKRVYDV